MLERGKKKSLKTINVIRYCEILSRKKISKSETLNDCDSKGLIRELNRFFESNIEIPRMRVGKRQTLETLISEEALLLAKYLRNERKDWAPRIVNLKI